MMSGGSDVNGVGLPHAKGRMDSHTKVTVVLGAQWGDEGKGKVVDMLAVDADIVCRCQVSASALRQGFVQVVPQVGSLTSVAHVILRRIT